MKRLAVKLGLWQEDEIPQELDLSPGSILPQKSKKTEKSSEPVPQKVAKNAAASEVDREFYGTIEEALQGAISDEFAEFYRQLLTLKQTFGSQFEEDQLFVMAFKVTETALQSGGRDLNVSHLTEAVARLKKALQTEGQEFGNANEQSYLQEVEGVQQKKSKLSEELSAKEQEILALKKQMEVLEKQKAEIETRQKEIASAISGLEKKKGLRSERFRSAFDAHAKNLDLLEATLTKNLDELRRIDT